MAVRMLSMHHLLGGSAICMSLWADSCEDPDELGIRQMPRLRCRKPDTVVSKLKLRRPAAMLIVVIVDSDVGTGSLFVDW